ncbi:MAG: hypothetical protein Q9203_002545 [Teloschistes exilis]
MPGGCNFPVLLLAAKASSEDEVDAVSATAAKRCSVWYRGSPSLHGTMGLFANPGLSIRNDVSDEIRPLTGREQTPSAPLPPPVQPKWLELIWCSLADTILPLREQ